MHAHDGLFGRQEANPSGGYDNRKVGSQGLKSRQGQELTQYANVMCCSLTADMARVRLVADTLMAYSFRPHLLRMQVNA
ncbi:MAG: hypothetical protein IJR87_04505 [Bacteroidaceae bacterium]|nr:hypothetical protein [Bacteroidaceae bacterium]